MAQKTCRPQFDPRLDILTDYFLVATGVGSVLTALIYLIVT
jgi:hypothetical protein